MGFRGFKKRSKRVFKVFHGRPRGVSWVLQGRSIGFQGLGGFQERSKGFQWGFRSVPGVFKESLGHSRKFQWLCEGIWGSQR